MTIWERPAAFVWDYDSASVEYLAPLYPLYGSVQVHLTDHGPVPASYVASLKAVGFRVFGVIGENDEGGVKWESPVRAAYFLLAEKARLGLNGGVANFEDYWEGCDATSGGDWTRLFLQIVRVYAPKWPLALNTYNECGGINLRAWADANARLYVQSYKGGASWEPPAVITGNVLWQFAKRYGWPSTKRAFFRPCLGVFKGSSGERVPLADQIWALRTGRSRGFATYYTDGAFDVTNEYLIPLAREAIAAGCAR